MGICRLPYYAIYSHDRDGNSVDIEYKNAIMMVMRKEPHTLAASTGNDWIGDAVSFQSYTRLALATEIMACYIKRIGYPASPQNMVSGYHVLLPPLLLWAGIGEVARTGIILNPFLGMAYKAAAVLTDMPLEPDMPIDFGLQNFCSLCRICADVCPSKAISSQDKVLYNGYKTWKLKEKNCAVYSVTNNTGTICQICAKACPWTNPLTWPHNTVRRMVQHSALAARVAIAASKLTGINRGNAEQQWWFDMHYDNNGNLEILDRGEQ
jgi:reductive dehalogenase